MDLCGEFLRAAKNVTLVPGFSFSYAAPAVLKKSVSEDAARTVRSAFGAPVADSVDSAPVSLSSLSLSLSPHAAAWRAGRGERGGAVRRTAAVLKVRDMRVQDSLVKAEREG